MSSFHRESLLLKAENPGSRGGIVVGYWPNGDPKYLSQLKGYSISGTVTVTTSPEQDFDISSARKNVAKDLESIEKLKVPNSDLNGVVIFASKAKINKTLSRFRSREDLAIIPYIPVLVNRAKLVGSEPDRKGRPDIKMYHYLHSPVIIDGKEFIAAFDVRELKDGKNVVFRFYTHQVRKKGEEFPGLKYKGLPPARGTTHSSSPGTHLAGNSKDNPEDDESQEEIQKAYISYQAIHKSSLKTKCHYCEMWEGTLCRVFRSEQDFMKSPYYGGGDRLENDPHGAEFAVWPGKTNANRPNGQWWICTPVHPNCSHSWESWSPEKVSEFADEDWYKEAQDELNRLFNLNKSTLPIVAENFRNLDQIVHRCEHSEDTQDWTTEYLRSRLLVNG